MILDIGTRFEQNLSLPFWKSKASVNLMVEKTEKRFVPPRLFNLVLCMKLTLVS